MTIRLKSPRLRVVLGDVEEPSTWQELTVQCIGADIERTEGLLRRMKRGQISENQVAAQAMFGYFALGRLGLLGDAGMSWEQFQQVYIEVTDPDDDTELEVRPTSPAAGPGS